VICLLAAEAHENERCDFEAPDHDLHTRAGVPATDPRVLLVGDLVQIAADGGKELVAEFYRVVFPVDLLARAVEGMVGEHLKRGQVPAGSPDRVEVV